ncbi:MAG: GMC family oxidoreductase [Oxalobacteraceae bacterium]|nr:MAG: GMC family oxidoreductase [Oxalobacteraceae bacterium]
MIVRLDRCEAESLQDYPFCIIGAGAAGISLAVALSRRGQRVLLLEAGDSRELADLEDSYVGEAAFPHPPTTDYRRQRFGGTTHLWGGRCVPLDDVDFEARAHVPHSGWPLEPAEYWRHLPEAMAYCDAGAADFSVNSLQGEASPMFDGLGALAPDVLERIERYSLPTDFARKFGPELQASPLVTVVLRARCLQLETDAAGARITGVVIGDERQRVSLRADHVILCGGGLEATRLLLNTRERSPAWRRFDASLGRYYGCHYDLIFGALSITGRRPHFKFQKTRDGVYARRKLQFSGDFQRRHGLLNSTFRLHFPPYADAAHGSGVLSMIYLAKSVLPGEYQAILNHGHGGEALAAGRGAHVRNVITDAPSVLGFGFEWLFKRKLAARKLPYTLIPNRQGTYPLEFNSEQVPDASNRVELAEGTDAAGERRLAVHWRLTSLDVESGVESFLRLREKLAETPGCRLDFDLAELRERVGSALPVGGHHIGSTRMGRSVEESVVDPQCRVHGVDNLFVVSSSVFPTNGHANPTLSIVALALRMAEHLHQRNQNV